MKLNKKTLIIGAVAVLALVLLFVFGGPGIRKFMSDIAGSLLGTENDIMPTEQGLAVNDPTEKPENSPTQGQSQADPTKAPGLTPTKTEPTPTDVQYVAYYFRSKSLLNSHYDKHGKDMGFKSAKEYEKAASDVINDPTALHKTEKEDGDTCYYIVATNEFVVLSKDGYIRTYFLPDAGKAYYDRQ